MTEANEEKGQALPEELAHRVLARAAELDSREGPTVPLARLRAIAEEAGISRTSLDTAIHELSAPKKPGLLGRLWERARSWLTISPVAPLSALTLNVLAFAGAWVLISLSTKLAITFGGNWVISYGIAIIATLLGLGMAVRARARLTAILLAIVAAAQLAEFPVRLLYGFTNAVPELALFLAGGFGLLLSRAIARPDQSRAQLPPAPDASTVSANSEPERDSPPDYTTLRLRAIHVSPSA